MSEYMDRIARMEADRRRLVDEVMRRPFGDRVMSDSLESELQELEEQLLLNPPIIGRHNGEPVYAGRGLLEDDEQLVCDEPSSIEMIPESQWPAFITGQNDEQQLHCEPFVKFTLNQGSVGSCAAEGGTGCLMTMRVMSGQPQVELNPYFVYHTTSGGRDSGSTLSATVQFLRDNGCAAAAGWSRSNGWQTRPSQAAYADAKKYRQLKVERVRNWGEFGTMLLHAYPVYFGYSGHAIFASRLIAPNRIRYKNSWGNWGDNGYGTLAASSIMWGYGVYVFTSVSEATEINR